MTSPILIIFLNLRGSRFVVFHYMNSHFFQRVYTGKLQCVACLDLRVLHPEIAIETLWIS